MIVFDATDEDTLRRAVELIRNKEEAMAYKKAYINWLGSSNKELLYEAAKNIAESNLGYYAGYYREEVRRRVEDLFECAHPIFGSVAEKGIPTNEEAFAMGMELGKKHKKN